MEVQEDAGYRRTLGLVDLSALGVAAIIGAGIFFLLGQEAQTTGPAVVIALIIGGAAALLAALSYAEASSALPGSGSAYAFAHAAFGSLPAFMVGWFFVNTYAIGNAGIAIGWQSFLLTAFDGVGITLPEALTKPPADGGLVNLPALILVLTVTFVATLPMRTSTRVNNLLVGLKLAVVGFVIVAGAFLVRPGNWTPVAPGGMSSIAGSTAVLFFAYVGFDTIAAAGAEAKRPRRNIPLAILVSMGVCTLLYVLMAGVVTGMGVPANLEAGRAPVAGAFESAGHSWAGGVVTAGALLALATVAYAFHVAMARILQAMARDGFLPRPFARVSSQGVPVAAALAVGTVTALSTAFLPLAPLIDMGVLAAMAIYASVSVGTLVVRRRDGTPRGFRVPWPIHVAALVLLVAIAAFGIAVGIHLWFLAWCSLGLMVYGFWAHRSSLRQQAPAPAPALAPAPTPTPTPVAPRAERITPVDQPSKTAS